MILARWRARRANRILIDQIHGEIVAAARAPALYAHWAVADSLDGRFEMIALHAGLVMRRLDDLGDLGAQDRAGPGRLRFRPFRGRACAKWRSATPASSGA